MRARYIVFWLWLLLSPILAGSLPLLGAGVGPTGGGGGGGCSQATTFLARTSGLSGTETTAYTNMICGLVTDGVFSKLDALYIFATNTTTTAALNIISTSFSLSATGTLTFTADHGWASNGTTGFLNTSFNPSTAGGNFAQNAASLGAYVLTSRTSGADMGEIGLTDGTSTSQIFPRYSDGNTYITANGPGSALASPLTNAQGYHVISRTASTTETYYKNGSSSQTPNTTSTALPNLNLFVLARNTIGSASSWSTDQVAAVHIGGGLTSTDVSNLSSRINGYMTALGINVY